MDRRQLLFGATALGLVTNLNLSHPLIAQVGKVMGRGRLSDRERAGLRGPVKTRSDFMGDEAESMSEEEYSQDGRLLVWRGRISGGSRVEQVYSYDGMGRLIGVTGGRGTDEFHYDEQGKKTRVRTVPPRPDRQYSAWDVGMMFEATEEGHCLNYGGSVTTRYNDDDQPIESVVQDAREELLVRIVHNYANGQLISETLVRESFGLPEEVREQLSEEQRRTFRAQEKEALSQLGFGSMERSYVYDDNGLVIKRQMRMGNFRQDITITYNGHGDIAETVMIHSGSLNPKMPDIDQRYEVRCFYQYDSHGNWIEKTTDRSSTTRRQLTYY